MPTANQLVAALCLAVLGAVVAELIKPQMPEGMNFGHFTLVSAFVGLVTGWRSMGRKAGRGMAVNNGITGVILLVVNGLLVFGTTEMIYRALDRRYDEPIEALEQIVAIALEYALYLADPKVIGVLVAGALISGPLTEIAYRRWR